MKSKLLEKKEEKDRLEVMCVSTLGVVGLSRVGSFEGTFENGFRCGEK